MSVIRVENLKKKFSKVIALDGISLEVNQGEVYGFIGPNGAGKTTTIRSMLGIIKADEGNITIFDMDAWRDAVELHKSIAYVPGDVSLWSNLTGGEVIDLFSSLRKSPSKKRREEMIQRFDLDVSKKCRTYSKGNRQKVALIAALSVDADLYILDEPTSGLDPLMERVFQEVILELKHQNKTIFLSSHILSEVEQLCDRLSIIREGKIIETGSLNELRHLINSKVTITTKHTINQKVPIQNLIDLHIEDKTVSFQANEELLSAAIAFFNQFEITHIDSKPPSLEDMFMHHYSNGG